MTPRLPIVTGAEAIKALGRAGYEQVSRRGSHVKLRNPAGRTVIVPMHHELAQGTLRSILRQAGITNEEFRELL
ncbi:MAG TPA: type II toxin-antitoxin system HicA family toxin [Actinomycetota bacterium]|nr:type II toxin-antitoxin system HicA family toxin [Actinomycetota bacterium]